MRSSWRTRGLAAAASLTGLSIDIPPQPPINNDVAEAFADLSDDDTPHPKPGASIAWLAHLDLLKHVVQSGLDTALIIEDDVDWDVQVRTQMVQIAEAVRALTETDADEDADAPYGRDWDVLWIGTCAETWDDGVQAVVFADETVPSRAMYRGFAKGSVERLPEFHRAVFWSQGPVCSFAYAVTREGAVRVLKELGGGQSAAFDLALLEACRTERLACVSVLPEVMHQYFPAEVFGVKSLVDVGNGVVQTEDEEELYESVMGSTENVVHSARCWALWERECLKE